MGDLRASADAVLMAAFRGPTLPDWARSRLDSGLGGVCLFGSNMSDATALSSAIHEANSSAIVALDEEGGDVTRLYATSGSPYPGNAALGAVDDVEATTRIAASIGAELAAVGVDLDLGACVDVNSNPDNPVIGVRSFGADPVLVARHGVAFVQGVQAAGVAACAKHFPGHGDTAEDSHVALPRVSADEVVLRSRELAPFVAVVEAGVAAVMTSHVLLPAFDEAPATFSRRLLTDILKGELGFGGCIVTDALDMDGACRWAGGIANAAVASLVAGADLLCLGSDKTVDAELVDAVADAIVAAVNDGRLDQSRLLDAGDRVRRLSQRQPGAAIEPDLALADDVATRAIRVEGTVPPLLGAVVATVQTAPGIAAGAVPWGPALPWAERDASIDAVDIVPGARAGDLLGHAAGRPLVLVVRSWPAWVRDFVVAVATERPDLVVVDMGWPVPDGVDVAAVVRTFGASAVSGRAVAELLAAR